MKQLRRILPLLLLLCLVTHVAARRPNREDTHRKAGYVYMQAINESQADNEDAAYDLLQHAVALDTTLLDARYELARRTMLLARYDSVPDRMHAALADVRRYAEQRPTDMYAWAGYARLASMANDTAGTLRAYEMLHRNFPQHSDFTVNYAAILFLSDPEHGLERAMGIYDTLEVRNGLDENLMRQRLALLSQRNDTAAILQHAHRYYDERRGTVDGNLFMSDVMYNIDRLNDALRYARMACELDSMSPNAAYSYAMTLREAGDSAGYDREIFRTLRLPSPPEVKMGIIREYVSDLYTDTLQHPRIIEMFEGVTHSDPLDPELRRMYGSFLRLLERHSEAALQLDIAQGLDPEYEDGWVILALEYAADDDTQRADSILDIGLQRTPSNPDMRYMKGAIAMTRHDYPRAITLFRATLDVIPEDRPELYAHATGTLADLYSEMQMPDSAIAYYNESLRYDPTNAMAMNNLAYFLAEHDGDLERALTLIEHAMSYDDTNATWVDTYAWVLYKLGRYADALEQIDLLIALTFMEGDEVEGVILEHAEAIYEANGRTKAQLQQRIKELETFPDDIYQLMQSPPDEQ